MSEFIDIDLKTAEEALSWCNYSDRDEWIQMGMALRSEFGDAAFSIWDSWSSQHVTKDKKKSYDSKVARDTWKGFRGRGITIGSLIARAQAEGFKFERPERTEDDLKRLQDERNQRLKAREIQEAEEQAEEESWRLRLSDFLHEHIDKFGFEGYSKYLADKKCPAFGLLFPSQSLVIVADREKQLLEMHYGREEVSAFFKQPKDERPSFRYLKKDNKQGTVAVPLFDVDGRIWNIQVLYSDGGKSFLPGRKTGCFHILGQIPAIGKFNVCEVEGYSNGAPIHMALGCPVIVAFDAGNLEPVARAFSDRFGERINRFAVCGDNDVHLLWDGKKNKGKESAIAAAKAVGGIAVFPDVGEESKPEEKDEKDALFDLARQHVIESQRASASRIQRKLRVGYNRANRILEALEVEGVVSARNEKGVREILIKGEADEL